MSWFDENAPDGAKVATPTTGPVYYDWMDDNARRIADEEYARRLAGDDSMLMGKFTTGDPPSLPGQDTYGRPDIVRNPGVNPDGARFTVTDGVPGRTGGQQPYSDGALQAILQKYPPTNDGMRAAMQEVNATFGAGTVQLLDHPERLDKLVTPTGTYDTIGGAGGPNPTWTFNREGAHGAGGGTLGGGLSGVGVTPEGQAVVNRVMGDMGRVGPLLGDPMAGRPITDDPSYGFRLGQGLQALERSAAGRGTLLTGGNAKAMLRYAQDVASQEYQNSYARRASEQSNDYGRLMGVAGFMSGEQMNQYNRYLGTAGLGLNAINNAQGYASGYAGNIGNAQLAQGNAQAAGTMGSSNAWAGTVGTLGSIGADWAAGRAPKDPNNPGGYLDYGRGLYS